MPPARSFIRGRVVSLTRRIILPLMLIGLSADVAHGQQNPHGILPIAGMSDPFLLLLHDPVVHAELKLDPSRRESLQKLCDELAPRLWTTRNQQADQASKTRAALKEQATGRLASLLTSVQRQRLKEVERRTIGIRVLVNEEMRQSLKLSAEQLSKLNDHLNAVDRKVSDISARWQQPRASETVDRAELDREIQDVHTKSQKAIWELLDESQKATALQAFGKPFDLTQLGRIRLRAPEFPNPQATTWMNSQPLTLKQLEGDVVVVFVWAFGCINCIRNYPSYLQWHRDFSGQGVKIIGVHTPEVDGERDADSLRAKLRENGFAFPVVVDNDRKIWNAWGNSMWPSTYVIDRRGYVRAWWLGELNWEQQPGEQLLRKKIEELLAEQ